MESFTHPGDKHTTAAAPNPPNRYTSIDSQTLLYDDAGSLTLDKAGYNYVYDYENRITRIYKLDGQTEITVARFAYDALGRRIMKEDSLNAANTRYYYYNDNWQIVTEYDLPTSAGVYKQLYAYGNYIDEVVYASCPGATYTMRRYLHDHLYSPAAIVYLTASNCILVERSEYDAYGAAHYYNADYTQTFAVSQHGNPFAFTGREIDSFDFASGVPQLTKMHYRHRDYSPFMGRFYQQDPMQYVDGLNMYEYVKDMPLNHMDPYGHKIDISTCQKKLDKIIETNQKAKKIMEAIKDKDCKIPKIECKGCDDELCKKHPTWGGYHNTGSIGICASNINTNTPFAEIIVHELIHAYDACVKFNHDDWGECELVACSEIRAYNLSGICNSDKKNYKQCVKNKAIQSLTTGRPGCAAQAQEYVDKVFEECFNNRAPIN